MKLTTDIHTLSRVLCSFDIATHRDKEPLSQYVKFSANDNGAVTLQAKGDGIFAETTIESSVDEAGMAFLSRSGLMSIFRRVDAGYVTITAKPSSGFAAVKTKRGAKAIAASPELAEHWGEYQTIESHTLSLPRGVMFGEKGIFSILAALSYEDISYHAVHIFATSDTLMVSATDTCCAVVIDMPYNNNPFVMSLEGRHVDLMADLLAIGRVTAEDMVITREDGRAEMTCENVRVSCDEWSLSKSVGLSLSEIVHTAPNIPPRQFYWGSLLDVRNFSRNLLTKTVSAMTGISGKTEREIVFYRDEDKPKDHVILQIDTRDMEIRGAVMPRVVTTRGEGDKYMSDLEMMERLREP